ncbi:hypothetical protein FZW78_13455 [Listeria monocytogenes]|uniref:hypothetical protein n=1 Tax=Listeria monocytogenes TaxID=1639 RepID=UPI0011EA9C7A|nr:hypothetical protein [Listeria monocytogenes]TYU40938.1 hypothetical protein FZW78_13455 [Listeria monocytogenes]
MLKLYKKEQNQILYAEYWINNDKAIVHYGKVGKVGEKEETSNYLEKYESKAAFHEAFINRFVPQGYSENPPNENFWILIQYPLKSLTGTKRDIWLKDRVTDVLNDDLGWKGLGIVDGVDIGQTANPNKQFALNIFCVVVDEEIGIKVIKSALRNNSCDYTSVKIASRPFSDDAEYTLKFSAKKKDVTFYV